MFLSGRNHSILGELFFLDMHISEAHIELLSETRAELIESFMIYHECDIIMHTPLATMQ